MSPNSTRGTEDSNELRMYREMIQRVATITGYPSVHTSQMNAGIEESTDLNAINDPLLWVDREHVSKPIKELEESHIKRILDGFNMDAEYHGQRHKIDTLVAQYEKLQHDK